MSPRLNTQHTPSGQLWWLHTPFLQKKNGNWQFSPLQDHPWPKGKSIYASIFLLSPCKYLITFLWQYTVRSHYIFFSYNCRSVTYLRTVVSKNDKFKLLLIIPFFHSIQAPSDLSSYLNIIADELLNLSYEGVEVRPACSEYSIIIHSVLSNIVSDLPGVMKVMRAASTVALVSTKVFISFFAPTLLHFESSSENGRIFFVFP